jgi:hypothetical protein
MCQRNTVRESAHTLTMRRMYVVVRVLSLNFRNEKHRVCCGQKDVIWGNSGGLRWNPPESATFTDSLKSDHWSQLSENVGEWYMNQFTYLWRCLGTDAQPTPSGPPRLQSVGLLSSLSSLCLYCCLRSCSKFRKDVKYSSYVVLYRGNGDEKASGDIKLINGSENLRVGSLPPNYMCYDSTPNHY